MKTREDALAVLRQYNESEALIRHAYAVEGVMRHFAVVAGRKVCPCNNIADATMDIDFDYYVTEVEKLCLGMKGE